MTNHRIYYDLSIIEPDSQISYESGIKIEISITMTSLWNNIYKKTLIEDEVRVDKILINNPIYNYLFNIIISSIRRFKPIYIIKFPLESIVSDPLDILASNSESKIIYDHIYLLLSLNQL